MEQQYITLITAVSSAVAGSSLTLFGVYISNRAAAKRYEIQLRHDAEQREQDLLRARGEELHAAISAWLKRTFIRYMRFYSVLLGNITYKQAQAQEADDLKTIHDVARMELLIDVYFPVAREPFDAYVKEREKAEDIRLAFREKWGKHDDRLVIGEDYLPQYDKVQVTMQETGEALQKSIVACIRGI